MYAWMVALAKTQQDIFTIDSTVIIEKKKQTTATCRAVNVWLSHMLAKPKTEHNEPFVSLKINNSHTKVRVYFSRGGGGASLVSSFIDTHSDTTNNNHALGKCKC